MALLRGGSHISVQLIAVFTAAAPVETALSLAAPENILALTESASTFIR